MLPKELDQIFEEYTEDDYNLYVTKVEHSSENIIVEFVLEIQNSNYKGGSYTQRWTIQTTEYKKIHVSFDFASFINITNDDPLLWEFTDTQCELYFSGHSPDPAKLFYDLYLTHKRTYGSHECFNVSFGAETIHSKVFQFSSGLLAKGPKKLMELYSGCLQRNGLDFSIIGERPSTYWDGKQHILESEDLNILFIGDTYIIGRDFSFAQQDQKNG